MKVYVVEEWLNDYPENGGGCQGVAHVFGTEEQAKEFCGTYCLFEDQHEEGETYYNYYEMEVE